MLRFISIILFAACVHLGYADEYAEECRGSGAPMKVVWPKDPLYHGASASRKSSSPSLILPMDTELFPFYIQVTYATTTNPPLSLIQGRKPKLSKPSQLEWVKT
jgi:hypothetical protein